MTSSTFRCRSVRPALMSVPTSMALDVGSAAGLPAAAFGAVALAPVVLEPVVVERVVDLVEVSSFMLSASCWCPGSGLRGRSARTGVDGVDSCGVWFLTRI